MVMMIKGRKLRQLSEGDENEGDHYYDYEDEDNDILLLLVIVIINLMFTLITASRDDTNSMYTNVRLT